MLTAPHALTLGQWQQAYRDGQSPAALIGALRAELDHADNAWIALASDAR